MTDEEFIRAVKTRCKVPLHFAKLEISDMDAERGEDAELYELALKRFETLGRSRLRTADFVEDPIFYLLTGQFGAGKTRVAAWLLKCAYWGLKKHRPGQISPTRTPLFIRANRLVECRFRSLHDAEDEDAEERDLLRERLFESHFLVIDDIGRFAEYKGERDFLERVIEERHDEERSTVLTGNLSEFPPRFADFLSMFENVPMMGRTRKERGQ